MAETNGEARPTIGGVEFIFVRENERPALLLLPTNAVDYQALLLIDGKAGPQAAKALAQHQEESVALVEIPEDIVVRVSKPMFVE